MRKRWVLLIGLIIVFWAAFPARAQGTPTIVLDLNTLRGTATIPVVGPPPEGAAECVAGGYVFPLVPAWQFVPEYEADAIRGCFGMNFLWREWQEPGNYTFGFGIAPTPPTISLQDACVLDWQVLGDWWVEVTLPEGAQFVSSDKLSYSEGKLTGMLLGSESWDQRAGFNAKWKPLDDSGRCLGGEVPPGAGGADATVVPSPIAATALPTRTQVPTAGTPTGVPTGEPTAAPTATDVPTPSEIPPSPLPRATPEPTGVATEMATERPTATPEPTKPTTDIPTESPSGPPGGLCLGSGVLLLAAVLAWLLFRRM